MPNQDIVDQPTHIRRDRRADAGDATPVVLARHTFRDSDDFKAHLVEVLGAEEEGQGIRGSMSRKRRPSGRAAETLGDPVLDAVASPEGSVVIGDETIDLRGGGAPVPADGTVAHAAPLTFTEVVNGAERWVSADGSYVEYRLGTGRLCFHAWKKKNLTQYWSIGAEISVINTPAKFRAADIESRYYMSVDTPCQIVKIDQDSDRNDTYLDEYEWGWNSQQPERVASRCRAVWHNAKFADIVTAGDGCENAPTDPNNPWDAGFPPEWNEVSTVLNLNGDWTDGSNKNATISVDFASLTVNMSAFGRPTATGSVDGWDNITVTFPDDATYSGHLEAPNRIRWSNNSVWTKVVNTLMDLNGKWTDGSDRTATIFAGANSIKIDMSDFDRSNAAGSIVDSSTIKVKFPDDQTYTAQLEPPNVIRWSNNSVWTRRT
jgi:hypothetical protein